MVTQLKVRDGKIFCGVREADWHQKAESLVGSRCAQQLDAPHRALLATSERGLHVLGTSSTYCSINVV